MKTAAIILARGGSKGIPGKNVMSFCGKPLMAWTIEQLQEQKEPDYIFVSSDSPLILTIARQMRCGEIERPPELSGDEATSESGWLHALEEVERRVGTVDLVIAPQVTSPLRCPADFTNAVRLCVEGGYDSMFSASPAKDLCLWNEPTQDMLQCLSYNPADPRRRRQDFGRRWIENGSFYLFKPEVLRTRRTRFGGKVGIYPMRYWQMFEIDEPEDVGLCEAAMTAFMEGILS